MSSILNFDVKEFFNFIKATIAQFNSDKSDDKKISLDTENYNASLFEASLKEHGVESLPDDNNTIAELTDLISSRNTNERLLIILDIDGTLRDHELYSSGEFYPFINNQIAQDLVSLRERGIDIQFNTGRSHKELSQSNFPHEELNGYGFFGHEEFKAGEDYKRIDSQSDNAELQPVKAAMKEGLERLGFRDEIGENSFEGVEVLFIKSPKFFRQMKDLKALAAKLNAEFSNFSIKLTGDFYLYVQKKGMEFSKESSLKLAVTEGLNSLDEGQSLRVIYAGDTGTDEAAMTALQRLDTENDRISSSRIVVGNKLSQDSKVATHRLRSYRSLAKVLNQSVSKLSA